MQKITFITTTRGITWPLSLSDNEYLSRFNV